MTDYTLMDCMGKLLKSDQPLKLVWSWAKQGHIDFKQFSTLIDHVESMKYQ
jgi:hypothetical protein